MSTPYPHGDTRWFEHDRFGLFIHWGIYALAARHEWVKCTERLSDAQYQRYFERFDPDLYDPKEWARLAKQAGMRYFVITTKHHDGFCLWDTKWSDYNATHTPWGKDLLRPMIEAFRAEGIRVGLYYSLLDWHHPEFPVDRRHPQRDDQPFREKTKHRDVRKYAKYMRDQVRELLTRFGPIDVLWFDGSYPNEAEGKGRDAWESEKLVRLIRKIQPDIVLNNRLDLPGAEDYVTPEERQPRSAMQNDQGTRLLWEACLTMSGSWGYYRDEYTWKSVDQLLRMLIDGVSKGGNMLLNVGPTARGEFDERARERLEGIGRWMRVNCRSIYGCGEAPAGIEPPPDCRYTYNRDTNRLYLHVFAWPFRTIHLPGMADRVEYAQFLHDASEIRFRTTKVDVYAGITQAVAGDQLTLELPVIKPNVDIPVVELFLKPAR